MNELQWQLKPESNEREKIGQGRLPVYSGVWIAENPTTGETDAIEVAVKSVDKVVRFGSISPETKAALASLKKEQTFLSQIDPQACPNLPRFYFGDETTLVIERVIPAQLLLKIWEREEQNAKHSQTWIDLHSSIKERATYIEGLILGLHQLLKQGKIHGDIKPYNSGSRNESIDDVNDVVLLDLEDVKSVDKDYPSISGTTPYLPLYKAIEKSKSKFATQADIFALALTAFDILFIDERPKNFNAEQVMNNHHVSVSPDMISHWFENKVHPGDEILIHSENRTDIARLKAKVFCYHFNKILRRALNFDYTQAYTSATQFRADFTRIMDKYFFNPAYDAEDAAIINIPDEELFDSNYWPHQPPAELGYLDNKSLTFSEQFEKSINLIQKKISRLFLGKDD